MTATDLFVQQEVKKFQGNLTLARRNVTLSKSLVELVRHAAVHPPAYLRSVLHRDTYQLQLAGERRAEEILKGHLSELDALAGEALSKRLGWLRAYEWRVLSGAHPRLAQLATREGSRLASRARSEASPALEA